MAWDDLFKEIGNTLGTIATEAAHVGAETLKAKLAKKYATSSGGQAVITNIRNAEIMKVLPYAAGAVVLLFVGILFFREA